MHLRYRRIQTFRSGEKAFGGQRLPYVEVQETMAKLREDQRVRPQDASVQRLRPRTLEESNSRRQPHRASGGHLANSIGGFQQSNRNKGPWD